MDRQALAIGLSGLIAVWAVYAVGKVSQGLYWGSGTRKTGKNSGIVANLNNFFKITISASFNIDISDIKYVISANRTISNLTVNGLNI